MPGRRSRLPAVKRPRRTTSGADSARRIALAVAGVLLVGTVALLAPGSWTTHRPSVVDALFTAVSALCVTGLTVLDTPSAWTVQGQVVIAVLIQIGGTGVMTLATLLAMMTAHRLGLRRRMVASTETRGGLAETAAVVRGIIITSAVVETLVALMLFARLRLQYGMGTAEAAGTAVFHAVSAFNNAGFALFHGNLTEVQTDAFILLPLAAAVIVGGLGFPVLAELRKRYRAPRRWSLTTKMVLAGTPLLLIGGAAITVLLEHANPGTLGPMGWPHKVLNAFFHATVSRTAGFNAVDVGAMHPETWLFTDLMMLVGGGPAGTAGGLKITTLFVLLAVVRSELRGDPYVLVFGKRLSRAQHREVITIVVLMVGAIVVATVAIMLLESASLDRVLLETTSAISTTGLSTGITSGLSDASKLMLCMLMFAGRVGPMTLGTALALRRRPLLFEPAKERTLIG